MRLGTDIIEINRIEQAIHKSARFKLRVYTPSEIEYCEQRGKSKYQSYAGIYAAKEATLKALGTGLRQGTWQDIEISHDEMGAPILSIEGPFLKIMKSNLLHTSIVSISHCENYAMSTVILKE